MTDQKFTINTAYLTDIPVQYGFTTDQGTVCSTTSSVDHPAFSELRAHLGHREFISVERGWWNGDRVLKPFYLNDRMFVVGEKFPCASALGIQFRSKNRRKGDERR